MNELAGLLSSGIIQEEDTAFIVVDFGALDERLGALKSAFPDATRHAVAIKTQPLRPVLKWLIEQGCGLEAASLEEVQMALECGAQPQQLVFDSPVKTRSEIQWCAQHAPGMVVNANSLSELERLPGSENLRWGLRVNPMVSTAQEAVFDVSNAQSKFGVAITRHDEIKDAFRKFPLEGLHVHVGSGADAVKRHADAVMRVLDLAHDIHEERQRQGRRGLTFMDVGGGLASAVSPNQMRAFADRIEPRWHADWEVWTEFGQWVHAPTGSAYSRIEYVEAPRDGQPGKAYVHLGADYFTRQVYQHRRPLDVVVYDRDGLGVDRDARPFEIVGPLCFAGDILTDAMPLPHPEEGDWVRFGHTGANTYGLWSRHCSRSLPKVIGRAIDGQFEVLQARKKWTF